MHIWNYIIISITLVSLRGTKVHSFAHIKCIVFSRNECSRVRAPNVWIGQSFYLTTPPTFWFYDHPAAYREARRRHFFGHSLPRNERWNLPYTVIPFTKGHTNARAGHIRRAPRRGNDQYEQSAQGLYISTPVANIHVYIIYVMFDCWRTFIWCVCSKAVLHSRMLISPEV